MDLLRTGTDPAVVGSSNGSDFPTASSPSAATRTEASAYSLFKGSGLVSALDCDFVDLLEEKVGEYAREQA
jgi:hypothetical protein